MIYLIVPIVTYIHTDIHTDPQAKRVLEVLSLLKKGRKNTHTQTYSHYM